MTRPTTSDLTEDLPTGTTCLDDPSHVEMALHQLASCGAACVVTYRVGELSVTATIREGREPMVTAPSCPLGPGTAAALGSFLATMANRFTR